jgi:hypothetical protein
LPVVLYGGETWSLVLKEECGLRGFENRVLRMILGPKRVEVTVEWRRLHNEEYYVLHSSPNINWLMKSRTLRWAGQAAHMGESRSTCRVLVGVPEERRPLVRPRHRWEDNIKINL